MIAKLGFILVVAAFGALMFAAGAVAPDSIRAPIVAFAKRTAALAAPAAPKGPAEPAAGKAAATAAASPPAAPAKDDAVALETLLLPTPLPEKGTYAIQAGQFPDAEAADELKSHVMDLGLTSTVVHVVDKSGQRWYVVAAGSFGSLDDARTARWPVSRDLGNSEPLPLMLLPPEKPKG